MSSSVSPSESLHVSVSKRLSTFFVVSSLHILDALGQAREVVSYFDFMDGAVVLVDEES